MSKEEKNTKQEHQKRDEVIIHKRAYRENINESVTEKRLRKENGVPKRNTIKYETKDTPNDDFFKKK